MDYQDRRRKRQMGAHLRARQTTAQAKGTSIPPQPTAVVALTTTFTPPASCLENRLTMMPPPGFMIWANEPVPFANQTVAACYPPGFLQHYTSVSSGDVGSSIAPAMSPFVCPQNYCTMFAEAKNYIACCPSGYQFHAPEKPIDPSRPAYGGTCYSDFAVQTNYPVIAYDTKGDTSSQVFSASTSGAQAYAHPIDGWALTSPSIIGCPTPSPSPSPTPSSSGSGSTTSSQVTASSSSSSILDAGATTRSKGLSIGAIAGAVTAGVGGLLLVLSLILLALAYRKKHRLPPPPPPPKLMPYEKSDDYGDRKTADIYRHEVEGDLHGAEIGTSGRGPVRQSKMNEGYGAFEMAAHEPAELDAGGTEKDRDSKGMSVLLDKAERARMARMTDWKRG